MQMWVEVGLMLMWPLDDERAQGEAKRRTFFTGVIMAGLVRAKVYPDPAQL